MAADPVSALRDYTRSTAPTRSSGGRGGSGGTQRGRRRKVQNWSQKLGTTATSEASGGGSGSDLPEITQRALDGSMGASKAKQVYERLMKSPAVDSSTKAQVEAYYATGQGEGGGGDKGLLGALVDNPLTNFVGSALRVIDKPKRAIAATADELQELVYGSEDDSSWWDNFARKEEYGFGDVFANSARINQEQGRGNTLFGLDADNKWVMRGAGLVGDILGDPLTYLTAGTVTAGKAGAAKGARVVGERAGTRVTARQAGHRAADAATENLDDLADEGLESLAKRLTQRGTTAASEDELAEIGLRGGLRFMGTEIVPHDAYRTLMGPLAQRARGANNRTFAKVARNRFGDDQLRELRQIAANADSSATEVRQALQGIRAVQGGKRVAGAFSGPLARELSAMQRKHRHLGDGPVDPEVLRRAVTGDDEAIALLAERGQSEAIQDMTSLLKSTRDSAIDSVKRSIGGDMAVDGGEFVKFAGDDYMPRFLTEDAAKVVAERSTDGVGDAPSFMQRAARAGDQFGEHQLGSDELADRFAPHISDPTSRASIEAQMEGLLREWGFDGQLFESDAYKTVERYIRGMEHTVGERVMAGRLRGVGSARTIAPSVDDEASRAGGLAERLQGTIGGFEARTIPERQARLADTVAKRDDLNKLVKNARVRAQRAQTRVDKAREAATDAWVRDAPTEVMAELDAKVMRAQDSAANIIRRSERELAKRVPQRDRLSGSIAAQREALHVRPPKVAKAYQEVRWAQPKFDTLREARDITSTNPDELLTRLSYELDDAVANGADEAELALRRRAQQSAQRMTEATDPAVRQVLAMGVAADNLEARLIAGGVDDVGFDKFLRELRGPHGTEAFKTALADGMVDMARWGHPDAQITDWQARAMVKTAEVAKDPNKFLKGLDGFNRWFKTYAVMTPGFHTRNSMGALFNNYVAGVEWRSYKDVGRSLKQWRKGGIEGVKDKPFKDFLVALERDGGVLWESTNISAELGADSAYSMARKGWTPKAMDKAGMGQLVGAVNNPVARASQRMGSNIEHYFRTVLAYDHFKRVAPDLNDPRAVQRALDEGVEKVWQFQFNYDDLSSMEQSLAKRVIPFWTWTSRNMPLQMEMILRQPKAYQRFGAFKQAVSEDEDSDLVPSWMSDSASAAHLGGGQYLTLDMPFSDVDDLTRGLATSDPRALLQSATPVVKTPFELAFGEQAWNAIPITDRQTPVPKAWMLETPGLRQALSAILPESEFGKGEDGEWYMSERTAYAMEQAWPVMGRARRLFPSEERFQQRHMSSLLSFLGVAHRTATDSDKETAAWSRARTLEATERRLRGRNPTTYKPEEERDAPQ